MPVRAYIVVYIYSKSRVESLNRQHRLHLCHDSIDLLSTRLFVVVLCFSHSQLQLIWLCAPLIELIDQRFTVIKHLLFPLLRRLLLLFLPSSLR